ncbi:hypothetical protein C2869_07425 [Saccharobesus litoralis]|uniref:Uncharacterized protein n=1 Tax=Saccharobesus litoralis TaxID=2172099 RepID=A0A2S0VQA8_9ALTE|nr:hypothetical protein [Saccharobesus litoralis]AWB66270.1 hypothetical protein C2869_07425 [Saccharobesus litoralis]
MARLIFLIGLITLSNLLFTKLSLAAGGFDIWHVQFGFVVGRSLILSESGNLIGQKKLMMGFYVKNYQLEKEYQTLAKFAELLQMLENEED